MADTTVEALPQECLSHVISFTSPCDAGRSAVVSAAFRDAADSDLAWEYVLPSDYLDITSRSVSPVELSSKKDLFLRLSSTPLLIDGGKKSFSIDKRTNKKSYMLSARELSIAWSSNSLHWSWKPLLGSSKISTRMLSPNTTYGAYLIIQLADRAFGLEVVPSEVSIEVGSYRARRTLYLESDKCKRRGLKNLKKEKDWTLYARDDGWLEAELGEFYNIGREEEEVKMWFREIKGVHLKGGIIVEGIELRPKQ